MQYRMFNRLHNFVAHSDGDKGALVYKTPEKAAEAFAWLTKYRAEWGITAHHSEQRFIFPNGVEILVTDQAHLPQDAIVVGQY